MKKTNSELECENRELAEKIKKLTKDLESAKYYEDFYQERKNELQKQFDELNAVFDILGIQNSFEKGTATYKNSCELSLSSRLTLFINSLAKH